MAAPELTHAALFGWGCLGGFIAAGVTLTAPWLYKAANGHQPWPGWWRAVAATLLLAFHTAFGGVAALMVGRGVTEIGQAIVFGFLWPTIFKSVGEAGKEALT